MGLRLRQLQVVHRHGDRTPLINIFKGSANARAEEEEVLLWGRQLPAVTELAQLRSKFSVHQGGETQTSFQQRPFGYLTRRGIEQMTKRDQPQLSPPVRVLPPEKDIINTYSIFPEIMQMKADLEKDNAEFAAREYEMAPIKQELMRLFPAVDSGQVPFTWLTAADYFVCRRSHQVPYIPGTEVHGNATERHLGFRFHQMQKALWDHSESKEIVIYSGHDVSLLSVLRTMDAEIANEISFWPDYSSALALELLEDENGKFFVRARLNGEVLAMGEDPDVLYSADRFRDMVSDHIGGLAD
ncbi:hypothetical protein AM588_10001814 [Phytophthora nicotianae]|uniref:Uncharacterized protein n=1 Tax=Phytophthora nicotianae TaxID=4792 RepID=A0A0W8CWA8_PHYNI|nr:hypothetical protein AM588_10001814 [Phytophthora nicotianae]